MRLLLIFCKFMMTLIDEAIFSGLCMGISSAVLNGGRVLWI